LPEIEKGSEQKTGQFIYLLRDREKEKEVRQKRVESFYTQKINELAQHKSKVVKFTPDYGRKSNVKVVVFGAAVVAKHKAAAVVAEHKKEDKGRAPASISAPVAGEEQTLESFGQAINQQNTLNQYKEQMRYDAEATQLKKQLQSYDQDFKDNFH